MELRPFEGSGAKKGVRLLTEDVGGDAKRPN